VKDLISKLNGEMYEFKEPWRATDKSLTIVVPIIAKTKASRDYVVLEEVKDQVNIIDTGGINQARIEGNVDKSTFIRGGTMLKGTTQERAIQFGIVVVPKKSESIPVHCIHASRGIRPGASFQVSGMSPHKVYSRMLSDRNQNSTWSEVHEYVSLHSPETPVGEIGNMLSGSFAARMASDDLVGAVESISKFDKDLREILQKIPDYMDQVGAVIIDPGGVVGLEMYDHKDSWKAFSESIMRSYGEDLIKEDKTGIFKPDMSAVIPLIDNFLKEIVKAKEEQVFSGNNARTFIVKTEEYVGEFTALHGKTIHILITRSGPQRTSVRKVELPIRGTQTARQSSVQRLRDWGRRLGGRMGKDAQVLTALQDKPNTWTGLKSQVPMSKATLSSRLREMRELGIIDKSKDENGVTRYSLTGIGQEYLQQKQPETDGNPELDRFCVSRVVMCEPRVISAEVCPKCHSFKISVWSFDEKDVNYECNACHHKWTEPRK
jgi:DNA-binding HxlR family transcriptional regulator